jgi:hypothetical protein
MLQTQKQLADSFAELAQKSTELIDEFTVNSETQRQVVRHGENLLGIEIKKFKKPLMIHFFINLHFC